jgi:outer membrane protein assembly factor BamB
VLNFVKGLIKMKKFFTVFLVLILLVLLSSGIGTAAGGNSLSFMFRVNPARTGRETSEGPKKSELKWEHRIGTGTLSSPVFDDRGVVYFASENGILAGFEPEKGGTVFSVSVGKSLYSTPALYNGNVYIAGGNPSYLYKFNIASASKKWKIPINSEFHSSPLITDDALFIGGDDGYLYAKDLSNDLPEIEWKYFVGSSIYSSPASSSEKIVFGADDGYLYCLTNKGKFLWKTNLGGKVKATPLIYEDYIYIGTVSGTFYKLSMNGDIINKVKIGGEIYSSAGLLSNGSLAVGSYDGYLYILSTDLQILHKFNAGGKIYSSPCIASDNTIYFGTLEGTLFAISDKGEKLFEFDARAPIYSSPSLGSDGTLYFGDSEGWVYAIGSKTGVITVYTNLDEAEYLIKGPRNYYGKGKTYVVQGAPEGEYTITYKDITGYKTPPSETFTLKENSSIHFEGVYQKIAPILSAIVVTTNLDEASFTINGPATYSGSGKESTFKNVPAGTYTVTFNDVEGYQTPESIQKEVGEGDIVTFSGEYIKLPEPKKTKIILQIGNPYMTVNGEKKEVDPGRGTAPIIIAEWSRTVLPIRAIVEALGGTISWDGKERKVTILFYGNVINLWIDKNSAEVNGKYYLIDSGNPDVTPIIKNSRTMVPVRFVAEAMGCTVKWNPDTKEITIIFVEPLG